MKNKKGQFVIPLTILIGFIIIGLGLFAFNQKFFKTDLGGKGDIIMEGQFKQYKGGFGQYVLNFDVPKSCTTEGIFFKSGNKAPDSIQGLQVTEPIGKILDIDILNENNLGWQTKDGEFPTYIHTYTPEKGGIQVNFIGRQGNLNFNLPSGCDKVEINSVILEQSILDKRK